MSNNQTEKTPLFSEKKYGIAIGLLGLMNLIVFGFAVGLPELNQVSEYRTLEMVVLGLDLLGASSGFAIFTR